MNPEERVYMVMGVDDHGDSHLFASDDEQRARAAYRDMKTRYEQVTANWKSDDS